MSHHLDSPESRRDPRLNLTDQYLFDADHATVLVLDVNTSLAGATAGFHPEARYEFQLHLDGAAREGLTYRLTFAPGRPDGEQDYELERLSGAAAGDDAATGEVLLTGRTSTIAEGSGGVRAWAGRAAEPFFLDLSLLGAMNAAAEHGGSVPLAGLQAGSAVSSFAGASVWSVVMEIPHSDAELRPGRRIAMWSRTVLRTDAGGWRQVNRAGLPMIWPIFRPADGEAASEANATHPSDDPELHGAAVARTVAGLVAAAGTSPHPEAYGQHVAARLLPDVLPYTIGEPAAYSFAGWNGRALGDDAPGVMFSLVTNAGIPTGLTGREAAGTRSDVFPYVVPTSR
jgi:hypothetical protein